MLYILSLSRSRLHVVFRFGEGVLDFDFLGGGVFSGVLLNDLIKIYIFRNIIFKFCYITKYIVKLLYLYSII